MKKSEEDFLRKEYREFMKTEKGKEWRKGWQDRTGNTYDGDFADYLYDFHTEFVM